LQLKNSQDIHEMTTVPTTTTIKLALDADVRRVALEEPTLAAMRKLVRQHFKLQPKQCKLLWLDDEGDMVTLATDAQVGEAITMAAAGETHRLLKIEVVRLETPASASSVKDTEPGSTTADAAPEGAALHALPGCMHGHRSHGGGKLRSMMRRWLMADGAGGIPYAAGTSEVTGSPGRAEPAAQAGCNYRGHGIGRSGKHCHWQLARCSAASRNAGPCLSPALPRAVDVVPS